MKITARQLHIGLLAGGALTLVSSLLGNHPFWGVLALIGLITLPGSALLTLLRPNLRGLAEHLLAIVALSLLSDMLLGLAVNTLSYFGLHQPLSLRHLVIAVVALLVELPLISWYRNQNHVYHVSLHQPSRGQIIAATCLGFLPVASIFGAITLNNQGPANLTMLMLAGSVIAAMSLVIAHRRLPAWMWSWGIFTIALALLFSTSIRGWHVTGHDLQLEAFVYQLTASHMQWSMSRFQDAYNACLSLTILPATLKALTHIDGLLLFKTLYPFVLALGTTGVLALSRRLAGERIAFVAAWTFVTFPTFFQDMPMLARQEMAFMFFIAFLLMLFAQGLHQTPRRIMIACFGLGMVLSHYSTTFVAVGLIGGAYALGLPAEIIRRRKHLTSTSRRALTIGSVLIIAASAIIWTGLITHTDGNIVKTIVNAGAHIGTILHPAGGGSNSYALIKTVATSPANLVSQYLASQVAGTPAASVGGFYAGATQAVLHVASMPLSALTGLGQALMRLHLAPNTIYSVLKTGYAYMIEGLLIIGVGVVYLRRRALALPVDYVRLAPVALALIIIQVVLPVIDYGLTRMIQQDLIFLALPVVLGALTLLRLVRIKSLTLGLSVITAAAGVGLLVVSGFTGVLTGGTPPQLTVSNAGFYYDAYSTTDQDTATYQWLSENYPKNYPINADTFTRAKLRAVTGIVTLDGIAPGQIGQDSYVVLSEPTVRHDLDMFYEGGDLLYTTYPTSFLDTNKDLIYSSGSTEVYR